MTTLSLKREAYLQETANLLGFPWYLIGVFSEAVDRRYAYRLSANNGYPHLLFMHHRNYAL